MIEVKRLANTVSQILHVSAVVPCVVVLSTTIAFAEPAHKSEMDDTQVVAQERVEKNVPGSYHYKSKYEMTTDGNGTYHSTYQSQKKEWFCCLNWFSSEDETSTESEKS